MGSADRWCLAGFLTWVHKVSSVWGLDSGCAETQGTTGMAMTDHNKAEPTVFDMGISQDGGTTVVSFCGELDFSTAPDM